MNAVLPIYYKPAGSPVSVIIQEPLVTKEAVHEEELMKSDHVRLSWESEEWFEIPVGSYIIPYDNILDIEGNPAMFTLYKAYFPERTARGYRYQPEFQHPKMWLRYVPMLFDTQDATGAAVRLTEYQYVGTLGTLLVNICDYINVLYGLEVTGHIFEEGTSSDSFFVVPANIDVDQTISITFKDKDVLSALDEVAKVADCEWHIDWQTRYLYFGYISLGITPYDFTVDENIGNPSVTRSRDDFYNAYLVQGSSRNNTRTTENGNLPVGTPLLLDETLYPDSILDKRETDARGRKIGPQLTKILNIDTIYPTYELYFGHIIERRKYKKNEKDDVTTERWSEWYTKLGRYVGGEFVEFRLVSEMARFVVAGKVVKPGTLNQYIVYFNTIFDKRYFVSTYEEDIPLLGTDEPPTIYADVHLVYEKGSVAYDGTVAARNYGSPKSRLAIELTNSAVYNSIEVGDILLFSEGFKLDYLPSMNKQSLLVDGLVPTIAMNINTRSTALVSSLGTREFEVEYLEKAEECNDEADVEYSGASTPPVGYKGTVIPAGYYRIKYKTEGSDNLIIPTTSEQGIIPRAKEAFDFDNNKCSIFNIAIDDTAKAQAQEGLLQEAERQIAELEYNSNNYTFRSNNVAFEGEEPILYIGRRVTFTCDNVRIVSRILKMVTNLDYGFEQELTVGNRIIKGTTKRIQDELYDLQHDFDNWTTAVTTRISSTSEQGIIVEYMSWDEGELYYYETRNRATGRIETSRVMHRGFWWECRRTLTAEEPWFGSSDWVCLGGGSLSLNFFTADETPLPVTVVQVRVGHINFAVKPYLLSGNEDVTAESVSSWKWRRESFDTASDVAWNALAKSSQRMQTFTDADTPDSWGRGKKCEFVCTATLLFDYGGEETIMNRVIF